ncbi:MAG: DUF4384 domain-containing protein [Acidobacteriaceae bacterium]
MLRYLFSIVLLFSFVPLASAATPAPAPVHLMKIQLQQRIHKEAVNVDPRHIFKNGDIVRFVVQPSVDAYLYVVDLTTSGHYDVLFPREDTGDNNHILPGHSYLLPATQDGWFQVTGPAGHERLYFVLSPIDLTMGQVQNDNGWRIGPGPKVAPGQIPPDITPRCDDSIFKSRGLCIDPNAGPQKLSPSEKLPRGLLGDGQVASRDLTFTRKPSGSEVESASPLKGPVVYAFLLAHK